VDFFVQLFTNPVGFYNAHELLIAQMGINAILAIAIFVTFYSGQLTLANAGFMAIGAYTTVIMNIYLPTPLALDMLACRCCACAACFSRSPPSASSRRFASA
jgi:branched-chain amino acid transport system permease protein